MSSWVGREFFHETPRCHLTRTRISKGGAADLSSLALNLPASRGASNCIAEETQRHPQRQVHRGGRDSPLTHTQEGPGARARSVSPGTLTATVPTPSPQPRHHPAPATAGAPWTVTDSTVSLSRLTFLKLRLTFSNEITTGVSWLYFPNRP